MAEQVAAALGAVGTILALKNIFAWPTNSFCEFPRMGERLHLT